jgi:hypothetical protein
MNRSMFCSLSIVTARARRLLKPHTSITFRSVAGTNPRYRLCATRRCTMLVRVFLILLLVSALTSPVSAHGAPTAQEEPHGLASPLYAEANAYNSGDAVAAAANFADNGVWVSTAATGQCSQQTPCLSRAAILSRLQDGVGPHQCTTILDTSVIGSAVTATVEVRRDDFRAVGIERTRSAWLVEVSQDKIAALYVVNDLTDPQTNQYRAIQAGTQAPGEPIPNPATPCG